MKVDLCTVDITTDASGDFTAVTPDIEGAVLQYRYVPDGTSPLDTGADLDIVGTKTGIVVSNQDSLGTSAFTKGVRHATHGIDGVAAYYHSNVDEPVEKPIYIGGESLTVTIANGGNVLSGTLYIWTGSP